jgi:hypothetical protein
VGDRRTSRQNWRGSRAATARGAKGEDREDSHFSAPWRTFDKMARALLTRRGPTKTRSRRAPILFPGVLSRLRRIAIPGFSG